MLQNIKIVILLRAGLAAQDKIKSTSQKLNCDQTNVNLVFTKLTIF